MPRAPCIHEGCILRREIACNIARLWSKLPSVWQYVRQDSSEAHLKFSVPGWSLHHLLEAGLWTPLQRSLSPCPNRNLASYGTDTLKAADLWEPVVNRIYVHTVHIAVGPRATTRLCLSIAIIIIAIWRNKIWAVRFFLIRATVLVSFFYRIVVVRFHLFVMNGYDNMIRKTLVFVGIYEFCCHETALPNDHATEVGSTSLMANESIPKGQACIATSLIH